MADGIDVSRWQGAINWAGVANAGKQFAVARSSIGMSTKDDTFVNNYKGMVDNGIIPGAYHLVTATSTGAQQASNWKTQLDAAGFDKGLLVLDVEGWAETTNRPPADTLAAVEYLCNWIRDTYKRTPIIYTGVFWREYLKQHPDNFGSKLWLAAYVSDPTPYIPRAWDKWKIWQYTSSGSVSGITGNVDLNESAGTLYSLQRLAGLEWDELATEAEIRAIVVAEANRVVSELSLLGNQNTVLVEDALADIRTAITDEADALATDLQANNTAINNVTSTLTDRLNQVLVALEDDSVSLQSSVTELKSAVDNLHKHVCKRVDLHA